GCFRLFLSREPCCVPARQPLTGHSLGGALAVLATAVLKIGLRMPVAGVYTYGQPRVGDAEFCRVYDQVLKDITFRYVNDADVVPHLPPEQLPRAFTFRQRLSIGDFLRLVRAAPAALATG